MQTFSKARRGFFGKHVLFKQNGNAIATLRALVLILVHHSVEYSTYCIVYDGCRHIRVSPSCSLEERESVGYRGNSGQTLLMDNFLGLVPGKTPFGPLVPSVSLSLSLFLPDADGCFASRERGERERSSQRSLSRPHPHPGIIDQLSEAPPFPLLPPRSASASTSEQT